MALKIADVALAEMVRGRVRDWEISAGKSRLGHVGTFEGQVIPVKRHDISTKRVRLVKW